MPLSLHSRCYYALLAGWSALVMLLAGCESLRLSPKIPAPTASAAAPAEDPTPRLPGGVHAPLRVSRFLFFSDSPLNPDDAVFRELEGLPDQVQRELRVPTGTAMIQVYLFEDQAKYENYMQQNFPKLPIRRAYFISLRPGTGEDLHVYTWFGEHLRIDLRHELTHGLLNSALKGVPLWLDEGLAGFFEQPPETDGVNTEHLEVMRKGPFHPDLARLEKISKVQQMEKPEYREAWGWVHFMLRGDPKAKAVLIDYLRELRTTAEPGPLLPRLRQAVPDPHYAFVNHLNTVALPAATPKR